jgi:hypothetical protein
LEKGIKQLWRRTRRPPSRTENKTDNRAQALLFYLVQIAVTKYGTEAAIGGRQIAPQEPNAESVKVDAKRHAHCALDLDRWQIFGNNGERVQSTALCRLNP